MIRLAAVLMLVACAGLSGCGTMSNMADTEIGLEPMLEPMCEPTRPAMPFGGVANDLRWMARSAPPDQQWSAYAIAAAIDMPLSLAGDVITLPYTVPYWLLHGVGQRAARDQQGQAPPSPQPAASGQQPFEGHFVLDPPSSITPDRVRGGIGPGY